MNIAIISPWAIDKAPVGGTERFVMDLATQMSQLGNNVEVIMLSGESCSINGVPYTSLDILGNRKAANEYDLQQYAGKSEGEVFYHFWASFLESTIDIRKFDIIQCNSMLFVDAWMTKPRIFTIHTNPFEYCLDWGNERYNYVIQKINASLPNSTVLTAPSRHYSNQFSRLFHRDVLTIPHAMNNSRFSHKAVNVNKPMSNHKGVAILLPSRLELIQKRPQIVFRGVALLPSDLKSRITIVASGLDSQYEDNRRKLQRIADKSGFRAVFTKFVDMNEAYIQADIVALPSKSESFGYAALESLWLNKPTILNNLPTFKEIGDGNSNAHFFDKTARAFAEELAKLINDLNAQPADTIWMQRYAIGPWAQTYHRIAKRLIA